MTVLLVTERSDLAADLVVMALRRTGADFVRLNQDTLGEEATVSWVSGRDEALITVYGRTLELASVSSTWFRRPIERPLDYPAREMDVMLEGLLFLLDHGRWMNHPLAIRRADNKLVQLRTAMAAGLSVPQTAVGNDPATARSAVDGPAVVAKTLGGARVSDGGHDFSIYSQALHWDDITDESIRAATVTVQQLVKPGVDIRIIVVGPDAFGFAIHTTSSNGPVDWRARPDDDISYEAVALPEEVVVECRSMCGHLDLDYAAFDFVRDADGRYWFLEVNPSGQWGWLERATGVAVSDAIAARLASNE